MAGDALKLPPKPEELRAEIERARAQIAASAAALKAHVSLSTDWRAWVRRRPGLLLAGAFALGFLIGYRRR